jgi:hypothetical protein
LNFGFCIHLLFSCVPIVRVATDICQVFPKTFLDFFLKGNAPDFEAFPLRLLNLVVVALLAGVATLDQANCGVSEVSAEGTYLDVCLVYALVVALLSASWHFVHPPVSSGLVSLLSYRYSVSDPTDICQVHLPNFLTKFLPIFCRFPTKRFLQNLEGTFPQVRQSRHYRLLF